MHVLLSVLASRQVTHYRRCPNSVYFVYLLDRARAHGSLDKWTPTNHVRDLFISQRHHIFRGFLLL